MSIGVGFFLNFGSAEVSGNLMLVRYEYTFGKYLNCVIITTGGL